MIEPSRASRPRRSVGALLALLVASCIAVLGLAPGTALAENSVVSSEPTDGAVLTTAPSQIVINFTEEIGDLRVISLVCDTESVALDPGELSGNERILTIPVAGTVPRGLCVVEWRVSDTDEEPNGDGVISFTVETDPAATTTVAGADAAEGTDATTVTTTPLVGGSLPAASADDEVTRLDQVDTGRGPLWLGRLLSTLGIAVVFGSLVVIAAAWPEGVEYLITVRFIRAAWFLAFVGTLLFTAAATAAVTGGSLGSGFSPVAWLDLLQAGWSGRAAFLRMVFVIASAWAAFRPDRVIDPVTQPPALGLPVLAVIAIGVGRVDGQLAAVGVLLGAVHAVAMAIWIGGAILLVRVVLAGPGEEDLVHAVRGFGRISMLAIVVTIVTGFAQMFRLDGGQLLSSGHGRVVVLKVALVAVIVFIGLSARQFAQQRLARVHEMSAPMAGRLRRAFGTEAAIGLVTLMLSSWLLALTPALADDPNAIDYRFSQRIEIAEAGLDVTVRLTELSVGAVGLEVQVDGPAAGLTGLEVMLTPPFNPQMGAIVQPIPLTEPGRAVRRAEQGLPIMVAGDWLLQINAATAAGVVQSEPIAITVTEADGTAPTTSITVPPSITVTIDPNAGTTVPS